MIHVTFTQAVETLRVLVEQRHLTFAHYQNQKFSCMAKANISEVAHRDWSWRAWSGITTSRLVKGVCREPLEPEDRIVDTTKGEVTIKSRAATTAQSC